MVLLKNSIFCKISYVIPNLSSRWAPQKGQRLLLLAEANFTGKHPQFRQIGGSVSECINVRAFQNGAAFVLVGRLEKDGDLGMLAFLKHKVDGVEAQVRVQDENRCFAN